jgi:hypothetical protein
VENACAGRLGGYRSRGRFLEIPIQIGEAELVHVLGTHPAHAATQLSVGGYMKGGKKKKEKKNRTTHSGYSGYSGSGRCN